MQIFQEHFITLFPCLKFFLDFHNEKSLHPDSTTIYKNILFATFSTENPTLR